MEERLKKLLNRIIEWWNKFTKKQHLIMIILVLVKHVKIPLINIKIIFGVMKMIRLI